MTRPVRRTSQNQESGREHQSGSKKSYYASSVSYKSRNGTGAISESVNILNSGMSKAKPKESSLLIFENLRQDNIILPQRITDGGAPHQDPDERLLTPELHAITLLALFHVNFVCAICNEAIIDCICLECGHSFCTLCLQQWLISSRICPTCYQFVKEDFGVQRTYCVDEFISEVYASVLELTKECFGCAQADPPCPPTYTATAIEIQQSVRAVRILNATNETFRQHLKQLRRAYSKDKHPMRGRTDFSILEQQLELFAGPDNVSLSAVVQFFLSSITAYITYEGGDSIENDFILVGAVSVLVWYTAFVILMRLLGYDGSFSELVSDLQFVRFVELPAAETFDGDSVSGSGSNLEDVSVNSGSSHSNPTEFATSMLALSRSNGHDGLPSTFPDVGISS